jgi:hypothetical protein
MQNMRPIPFLFFIAALVPVPAGAQSVIRPDDTWQAGGPNARAAQRPLGPNAQVAQREKGPNAALARPDGHAGGQIHYPSCSAAGAARAMPVRRGEPGYGRHLDRDGDGVACE